MFTFLLFISIVILAGLLVSALLPLRYSLFLSGALATFQLFTVPIAGIFPSFNHLASLALWRSVFSSAVWRHFWFQSAVVLILMQAVAVLWSPNPFAAFRQIIYWIPFIFLITATSVLYEQKKAWIDLALKIAMATSAVAALLVIVFRILPSIEAAFLNSAIARLFISANALAEIGNGAYTVADPNKAGGFFINANVAAAFLGSCFFISMGLGRLLECKWLYWVGLFDLLAIFFAGSKAGVVLAMVLPVAYFIYDRYQTDRMNALTVLILLLVVGFATLGGYIGYTEFIENPFVQNSEKTLNDRIDIWTFVGIVFAKHPFTGLGYGGWEIEWPVYAIATGHNPLYPPHNAFLILYVRSGLPGLIAGIVFAAAVMIYLMKLVRSANMQVSQLATPVMFAFAWLFIQSMGENYGILGESHMLPLMAIMLGYLYSMQRLALVENKTS